MSTILSQQILSGKLLLVVTSEQISNLSGKFKLKPNNKLSLMICCENVVNIALLILGEKVVLFMCDMVPKTYSISITTP